MCGRHGGRCFSSYRREVVEQRQELGCSARVKGEGGREGGAQSCARTGRHCEVLSVVLRGVERTGEGGGGRARCVEGSGRTLRSSRSDACNQARTWQSSTHESASVSAARHEGWSRGNTPPHTRCSLRSVCCVFSAAFKHPNTPRRRLVELPARTCRVRRTHALTSTSFGLRFNADGSTGKENKKYVVVLQER